MKLFPRLFPAALLCALAACQPVQEIVPTSVQIEADAMTASHNRDRSAEQRVAHWAGLGLPVAERELGLLYQDRPEQRLEAMRLFEKAARASDTEAAFELAQMYRATLPGKASEAAKAWPWYRQAALQKHPKAALMLALLSANGEGVPRDDVEAARWLAVSSELGNAHAMFLLYNAYREGRGVERDPARAHGWLEESADHEYPPAIQELAMTVQHDDALRAGRLMKEATEHRHNNWNKF